MRCQMTLHTNHMPSVFHRSLYRLAIQTKPGSPRPYQNRLSQVKSLPVGQHVLDLAVVLRVDELRNLILRKPLEIDEFIGAGR